MDKLGQTMQVNETQLSMEDLQNLQELQSNILTVLAAAIRKNSENIDSVADMLMDLFMRLLDKKDSSYIEDDVYLSLIHI